MKAKLLWPDTCISVFGLLAICCRAHLARSKNHVLDSAKFFIFKIRTLNSCGSESPFFNRRVLLSFRGANNSYIILMLYSFNYLTTNWSLILNWLAILSNMASTGDVRPARQAQDISAEKKNKHKSKNDSRVNWSWLDCSRGITKHNSLVIRLIPS